MLAKDNEYFTEASNTLCDLYADINVRERCRDREDYELLQKYLQDTITQQGEKIVQQDEKILQQEKVLAQKDDMLEQKENTIEELEKKIQELTKALKNKQ